MKYLIINADDFGLHEYINAGIIKGFKEGFITSTSLMCSAPAFENAVELAKANPALGIGIHLTLVGGVAPLLPQEKVSSLVDETGVFPLDYVQFIKKFALGKVCKNEILAELSAQIERGMSTGVTITHFDSHQHLHVLPGLIDIVIELSKKYGIDKIRIPSEEISWTGGYNAGFGRIVGRLGLTICSELARRKLKNAGILCPDHFFGMLAGGNLTVDLVANMLENLPDGYTEIMTHPGLHGDMLANLYPWGYHWESELAAFTVQNNIEKIESKGISLINFGGLNYAK